MYVPDIDLHEVTTLDETAVVMRRHGPEAALLAGGTDLLVDLKTGRKAYPHLIAISGIEALHGLSEAGGALRIGALTTIEQLNRASRVRERFSALRDATGKMAAPQVRAAATVGGNIASAVPCADLPPILTAMHASVVVWSPRATRKVPLEEFFLGARRTALQADEVLTGAVIPDPPSRFGAAYARFGLRDGNTIAVAAVAASLVLDEAGVIRDARIVLGAVAPVPKLVRAAGTALVGQTPGASAFETASREAMAAAEPISDVRGSAEYRRELVGILTRRALDTAYERIREAASWR